MRLERISKSAKESDKNPFKLLFWRSNPTTLAPRIPELSQETPSQLQQSESDALRLQPGIPESKPLKKRCRAIKSAELQLWELVGVAASKKKKKNTKNPKLNLGPKS